jgi:hypothetical protein
MGTREKRDLQSLTSAAELFAKVTGSYPPEQVAEMIASCGISIEGQTVSLREAYDKYINTSTYPLIDLVGMAKRGDMILKFGVYVRLDDIMKKGRLDKIYRKAMRSTK